MTGKGYPIVLTNLQSARCVVVGGGQVAERKVEALLECEAQVVVVSPAITERIQGWAAEGRLVHTARTFEAGDLDGALLVFAATNSREVNAAVACAGREAHCLVNVADDPLAGDFHTAAAVRQGDLLLAVSTGGASPAIAALVRRKLLAMFGPEYAALLDLLGALLVFAATNSREVNAAVARAAREACCLVNVADDPLAGDFHTAAAVRQGDLLLAVSTGGASPAVAALVRRKLLAMFGPEYAALLELLGALRSGVSRDVPPADRPKIWRSLATDEVLAWLRAGDSERARIYAEELIARAKAAQDV